MFSALRQLAERTVSSRSSIGRNRIGDSSRSEEHTSELQSLMRISYAVFCLKKKKRRRPIQQAPLRTSPSDTHNQNEKRALENPLIKGHTDTQLHVRKN